MSERHQLGNLVGKTIVSAEAPDGWPILRLDDGSMVYITDEEGVGVCVDHFAADAIPKWLDADHG